MRKKERIIKELKSRISLLEFKKRLFIERAEKIVSSYENRIISYYEYQEAINERIAGKNLHEWVETINDSIQKCRERIILENTSKPSPLVFFLALSLIFSLILFFIGSELFMSGRAVDEFSEGEIRIYDKVIEKEPLILESEIFSEKSKGSELSIQGGVDSVHVSIGPSSMEGSVFADDSYWISAGLSITIPGSHPAATITFSNAKVILPVACDSDKIPSGMNLTIPLNISPISIPISDSSWFPTGDQKSILSFQGSIQVNLADIQNICGSNATRLYMNYPLKADFLSGAFLEADMSSIPSSLKINVRFHYSIPAAKGKPNVNCQYASTREEIDGCSAGWSSTESFIPLGVNYSPYITAIGSLPSQNPIEASYKSVIFYVTANDSDGYSDISSVSAKLTKSGQPLRQDSSCAFLNSSNSYSAIYSCSVKMWYFDSPGNWNINVTVLDLSGASAENSSTYFQYNQLQAISISPDLINFGTVSINSENKTAVNDPTIVSNTGNANLTGKIALNARDLYGVYDQSTYISSSVISANVNSSVFLEECSGTFLSNNTDITINRVVLEPGNLSAGKAQERVYYCLTKVQNVTAQVYSTDYLGSWTIKVLLASIFIPLSKKRKKQKIKKEISREKILRHAFEIIKNELGKSLDIPEQTAYNLVLKTEIPVSVFSSRMGALEAIVVYLRENLSMSYHEIADILKRNDRTIWASYNNAKKKMKSKLKLSYSEIFIPLEVFSSEKNTVLESLVLFLKNKGMKYSQISKIISRNQKSVRAAHIRALGKLSSKS